MRFMVDRRLVSGCVWFFNGLYWKCRCRCISILSEKQHCSYKSLFVCDCLLIFHQNGCNLLLTQGTTIKTAILTLVEVWWVALNPWNGRARVVPWPILFERVVPKRPVNHRYFWVWCSKYVQGCSMYAPLRFLHRPRHTLSRYAWELEGAHEIGRALLWFEPGNRPQQLLRKNKSSMRGRIRLLMTSAHPDSRTVMCRIKILTKLKTVPNT